MPTLNQRLAALEKKVALAPNREQSEACRVVIDWWNEVEAAMPNTLEPMPPDEPPEHFTALQREAFAALKKFYLFIYT